jgi:putative ABC transport system permease protein
MFWTLLLALRALRRRPGYVVLTSGTLAIGITASVSLYTVVDAVLLRGLPFREPERLAVVWQTNPEWRKKAVLASKWDHVALSWPQYVDVARLENVFEGVAAWREEGLSVGIGTRVEYARVTSASESLMRVLGVQPVVGRYFAPSEAQPQGARVALISDDARRAWFAGDSEILGRPIRVGSETYSIVGVLPRGFTLDSRADAMSAAAGGPTASAVWIPAEQDTSSLYDRSRQNFQVVGRLRAGVALAAAEPRIAAALHPEEKEAHELGVLVAKWQADQTRDSRGPLLLLLIGAVTLLVVACANTAILVLGESAMREREIASRLALGAERLHIIWQLLIESGVIAIVGAGAGLVVATWVTRLLVRAAPERIVGVSNVSVGWHAVLFALAATATTTIAIGVLPASLLSRIRPADALRQGIGQSDRGQNMTQRAMVGVQFALSIVLLVSASLLYRGFGALTATQPGFSVENLIVVQPELPASLWGDTTAVRELFATWIARLAAVPGVKGTAASTNPPFAGGSSTTWLRLEGERPDDPASKGAHPVQVRVVTREYFSVIGTSLRAGRVFDRGDGPGTPPVVIVSQALADRDFREPSPLGQRIYLAGAWRTIVGVVGDVHFRTLGEAQDPAAYYPLAQSRTWTLAMLVRTNRDPRTIAPTIRRVMTEVEPRAAIRTVDIMANAVARSLADERYGMTLMLLFGGVATVLATIGIYGVTMRTIARRRRELAIRRALGATRGRAIRSILRSTLSGIAGGSVIGILGTIPAGRVLAPHLHGVAPFDPLTYGVVLGVLALATLAALARPAFDRADNFTQALRSD